MDVCQDIQAPCDTAQNQASIVENAHFSIYDFAQAESQMDRLLSAGNADPEGRSGDRNERVDRSTTHEQVRLTQNVSANENTPASPHTSQGLHSIEVTDKSGSDKLLVKCSLIRL